MRKQWIFLAAALLSACHSQDSQSVDECEENGQCPGGFVCSPTKPRRCVAESGRAPKVPLTVTIAGDGAVEVAGQGTCDAPSCAYSLDRDASVSLTAAPDPGWRFASWSGDCAGSTAAVTMKAAAAMTCTATFVQAEQRSYDVTVSAAGGGSVAAAALTCGASGCSGKLAAGTPFLLTATAEPGWRFAGWAGSSGCDGKSANPLPLVVDGEVMCRAAFVQGFVVSATSPTSGATVTVAVGDCAAASCPVDSGASVTLVAGDVAGWRFAGWSGDEPCVGNEPTLRFTATASAACVAAYVRRVTVAGAVGGGLAGSVTATSPGARSTCAGAACVADAGDAVTLVAPTIPGYRLAGWTGEGCAAGTVAGAGLTLTAGDSLTCTAGYVEGVSVSGTVVGAVGAIAASSTAPGAECSPGACGIDAGGTVVLAAPDLAPGFRFLGWSGDAGCAGTERTIALRDVQSSVACSASYVRRLTARGAVQDDLGGAVVAATADPAGSCAAGACTVDSGQGVTLTAPPVVGHRFKGWSGSAGCSGDATTLTVHPTDGDLACVARYALRVRVGAAVAGAEAGTVLFSSRFRGRELRRLRLHHRRRGRGHADRPRPGAGSSLHRLERRLRGPHPLDRGRGRARRCRLRRGLRPPLARRRRGPARRRRRRHGDQHRPQRRLRRAQLHRRRRAGGDPGRARRRWRALHRLGGRGPVRRRHRRAAHVRRRRDAHLHRGVRAAGHRLGRRRRRRGLRRRELGRLRRILVRRGQGRGGHAHRLAARRLPLHRLVGRRALRGHRAQAHLQRRRRHGLRRRLRAPLHRRRRGAELALRPGGRDLLGRGLDLRRRELRRRRRQAGDAGGAVRRRLPADRVVGGRLLGHGVGRRPHDCRRRRRDLHRRIRARRVGERHRRRRAGDGDRDVVEPGRLVRQRQLHPRPGRQREAGIAGPRARLPLRRLERRLRLLGERAGDHHRQRAVERELHRDLGAAPHGGRDHAPGRHREHRRDVERSEQVVQRRQLRRRFRQVGDAHRPGGDRLPLHRLDRDRLRRRQPAHRHAHAGRDLRRGLRRDGHRERRRERRQPDADGGASTSPGASCSGAGCALDSGGDVTLQSSDLAPGFRFKGWSGDAGCAASSLLFTVGNVTASKTCVATWVQRITVAGTAPSGTVTASSTDPARSCTTSSCAVDSGQSVTLAAPSIAGYRFTGWSTGCGTAQTTTISPTANVTCTAQYVQRYTIAAVAGANGSVTANAGQTICDNASCTVDAGTSVTLTASAGAGYRFGAWSGAGCSGGSPLTLSDVNATCSASFVKQYTIAAVAGANGNVTAKVGQTTCPNNSCTVNGGVAVTLTATGADASYRLSGWSGGTGCTGSGPLALQDVTTTCTASFVRRYTIIGAAGPNGSVAARVGMTPCLNSTCIVDAGVAVTLTALPATNYHFNAWSGTGCTPTGDNPISVSNVDTTCTASFAADPTYTASGASSPAGGGTISASAAAGSCANGTCTGLPNGAVVTFSESPMAGFVMRGWSTNCGGGTGTSTTATIAAADVACTAYYRVQTTGAVAGHGSGSITAATSDTGGSCTTSFSPVCTSTPDSTVTFTVTPDVGSRVGSWSGGCAADPADPSRAFATVGNAPATCTANLVIEWAVTLGDPNDVDADVGAALVAPTPVSVSVVASATSAISLHTLDAASGDFRPAGSLRVLTFGTNAAKGIIAAGENLVFLAATSAGFSVLGAVSPDGALLWKKTLAPPSQFSMLSDYPAGMVASADGKLRVLSALTQQYQTVTWTTGRLSTLATDGSPVADFQLCDMTDAVTGSCNSSCQNMQTFAIADATGKGGSVVALKSSALPSEVFVAFVTYDNTVRWARRLSFAGRTSPVPTAAATLDNGTVAIAGHLAEPESGRTKDAFYAAFDAEGGLVYASILGRVGATEQILGAGKGTKGRLLLAGQVTDTAVPARSLDAWLVTVLPDGRVEYQVEYGGDGTDSANAVLAAPGGGYYLGGATSSFAASSDVWMVRPEMDPRGFQFNLASGGHARVTEVSGGGTATSAPAPCVSGGASAVTTANAALEIQRVPPKYGRQAP